jgi:hypothetical protein
MFSRIPAAIRLNNREPPPWLMKGNAIPLSNSEAPAWRRWLSGGRAGKSSRYFLRLLRLFLSV